MTFASPRVSLMTARTQQEPSPRTVLEAGLSALRGRPTSIVACQRQPLETSSHPVEEWHVRLETGESLPIIFKRLTSDIRRSPNGSRREVEVYRRLLFDRKFGAPQLYASLLDETKQLYWIFLEDVGRCTLRNGDLEDWAAAVRLLAEIHGAYLGRESKLRALHCLAEHDAGYYRAFADQAIRNLELAGNGAALDRFLHLVQPFDSLAKELPRQARTLVHGDIIAKNLGLGPGSRIRPMDWELAGIGSPMLDLARLLDGWGTDKPAFVENYLDHLDRHALVPIDRPSYRLTFSQCEIVSILWNLSWSVDGCRDHDNVNDLLNELDNLWKRLGQEPARG